MTLAPGMDGDGRANPADPMAPVPFPELVPASEGMAAVRGGAKLYYWDTGGPGPAVVFVHPNAGSAMTWAYQQPAFAKAGCRAIAYSRRNHYKSDLAAADNPGIAWEDLADVIDFLSLDKVHLIGAAQGGAVATEYALAHPERLSSLVIASRTAGVKDGPIAQAVDALKPDIWGQLPRWFQEIGPSYRAANPEGVKRWLEVNHEQAVQKGGARQIFTDHITVEMLGELNVPTLFITGTADLTAPPSLVRIAARHIPNSELVVVVEAGHSLYWEQPETFNRAVLDFIARHKK